MQRSGNHAESGNRIAEKFILDSELPSLRMQRVRRDRNGIAGVIVTLKFV